MALSKPILYTVSAFDATQPHTFYFNVIGGNQPVANRLVIRNNATNAVVYDKRQDTYRYEHTVLENLLTNGTYYNAVITTFDSSGAESPQSNTIQFWCYSQPTLTFTNIPAQNVIENSSFNFEFTYAQAQGELLNTYTVNLYNASRSLVSTSGPLYPDRSLTPPLNLSYLFTGFDDNNTYFIEVNGSTVENTSVTTGQVQITVKYLKPEIFAIVELTNNCQRGYISIKSNMVLIEGESNPDPPIYIADKEVDLTADGSWVRWRQGYAIPADWTAKVWFRKPNNNSQLIQFSDTKGGTVTFYYNTGYENVNSPDMKAYFSLRVTSMEGSEYYIISDYVDILPETEQYCVWIRGSQNLYQIITS